MSEEVVLPIPNLTLPQHYYILSQPGLTHLHNDSRKALVEGIEKDGMSQYTSYVDAPS